MTNAIQYTTQYGDRWTDIADRAYGEFHRWPEIAKANPQLALVSVLTAGTDVWVPVIEAAVVQTSVVVGRPPWK